MVGVEEGREFRFRGDLYSQESTFPLVFCILFSDFFQTNYLNIYRTDLHEIYRIDRILAVDQRSKVILSIS